jgi:two-component system, chemotaxis family, chemotaxis protein CheY
MRAPGVAEQRTPRGSRRQSISGPDRAGDTADSALSRTERRKRHPQRGRRKRVLIVEQEPTTRWTIGAYLRGRGYIVHQAESGPRAFERLRHIMPHVILLGLPTPGMGSREFVKAVCGHPAFAGVPVVLLSGEANLSQLTAELRPRASLAKPVDLDILAAIVDRAASA